MFHCSTKSVKWVLPLSLRTIPDKPLFSWWGSEQGVSLGCHPVSPSTSVFPVRAVRLLWTQWAGGQGGFQYSFEFSTCDFDSVVFIHPRDALTGYWFYRLSRYKVKASGSSWLIISSLLRLPSNISGKRLCSDCFWRTQMMSGRDWAESAGQERVGSLACVRYWTETEFQISNACYLWIL